MPTNTDIGMPSGLDVQANYTVRAAALDASGNAVAGVKVGTMVLTADAVVISTSGGGGLGDGWFLVPGPGA